MTINLYPRRDEFIESEIAEYVFVIDCSGSMRENEIELAKPSSLVMIYLIRILIISGLDQLSKSLSQVLFSLMKK
jgi:hypothetical protein